MYYYALIDSTTYVCYDVIENETQITDNPYYIQIDSLNTDLILRKKYVNGEWLDTMPSEAQNMDAKYIGVDNVWLDDKIHSIDNNIATHTHSQYALSDDLDVLEDIVNTKANENHTHSEYATTSHTHDNYALSTHTHTASEIGAAIINHNHDSDYADITHNHNDIYYTETEIDTKLSSKSDTTHTHTGIYDASGAAANALSSANAYTDSKIDALVGQGASTTLDTIGEISSAIEDNQDAIDILNSAIANKASASDLTSHTGNSTIHITSDERSDWNVAKIHANSTHAPINAEANQNAFSNVAVGNATISADTKTDTLTLIAGNNITLTPNADSDSITIASANTTYSTATQSSAGLMSADDKIKLDSVALNSNNYVLPSAGSALGGVKTGGDVTISNGVISVNDDSHNHTISNIDGLQSALDGKSSSTHNHDTSYYTQSQVDTKDNTTLNSAKDYADSLNTSMDSRMDSAESKLSTIASGAEVNQNAFSNVVVGSTTISADSKTDNLTMAAGTGISISADATNDKVTITNSGVRSISTGSSNGTISVNTNGTSANVAVKGLGSAAYTASTAYDSAGTAQIKADNALEAAKDYADTKVASLINGAPTTLDTLKEIADAMAENDDVVSALNTAVGTKANSSDLTSHTSNKSNPHNVTLSQLGVTATSAELNKLDSVTATTAEINIMDGVTVTTAEINYLDGVTSNIQEQLDGKSASTHTHNYAGSASVGGSANSAVKLDTSTAGDANTPVYFSGGKPIACTSLDLNTSGSSASCTGNSATATKLQTARTIGLGTGVTGTATSFNGTGNITIPVTDIKESYLSWGGKNLSDSVSPIDAACSNIHSANRFALANPSGITIEYSTNGSTYNTYSTTDSAKINLVSGIGSSYYIGARSSSTTVNDKLRITLNATNMGVYTRLRKLLINISTNYATGSNVVIEKAMKGSETTFTTVGTYQISGWSGWNSIPIGAAFGGGSNQTSNIAVIRLTFGITGVNSNQTSNALSVLDIIGVGDTYWQFPSTMAKTGHIYTYDSSKNTTFPASVIAPTFSGGGVATVSEVETYLGI